MKDEFSDLKILSCRPAFGEMGASALVTFVSPRDAEALQNAVKRCPSVVRAEFKKISRNTGVGVVDSLRCACSRLGIPSTHIAKIETDGEEMIFHVILSSRKEVEELKEKMKKIGVAFRLEGIRPVNSKKFLTQRQEQILVHAFMKGYFEYPRPVSIAEMAKDFGVSAPAYVETLRKALSKVVSTVV